MPTLNEFTFSKFVDDEQLIWDASSLAALQTCPQYYKLGTIDGWKIPKEGIPTLWGSAVHLGLEVLDRGKFYKESKDGAVNNACEELLRNYGEALTLSGDNTRNLESALRVIVWRAEDEYENNNVRTAAMPDGTPGLEVRFECPIPDTKYRISGRIDKLAYVNDDLYITDFKTTKSGLNEWYFQRYAPNTQVYVYLWALRKVLGMEVKGFIIDAIQTGVNFTRFGKQPFNVTDNQIDEWLADTQWLLSCVDTFKKTNKWPHNFGSCGNYGGCTYRSICSRTPEHRQSWLDEDFIKQPYGIRTYTEGNKNV